MAKWTDKHGNVLCPIKDMTETHAQNVLNYLCKRNSAKKVLYLMLKGYDKLEEKKKIKPRHNSAESYAATLNGDMAQQSILHAANDLHDF